MLWMVDRPVREFFKKQLAVSFLREELEQMAELFGLHPQEYPSKVSLVEAIVFAIEHRRTLA
jgi:hypothetical protein